MNLSGSGTSWTLGPRGASVGIGRRGASLNTGIPGTGLYARQSLSGNSTSSSSSSTRPGFKSVTLTVAVDDAGNITFTDESGTLISEELIAQAKKQQGDVIKNLIQKKCDEINTRIEDLGHLHHYLPAPEKHRYQIRPFPLELPVAPKPREPSLIARIIPQLKAKNTLANEQAAQVYQAEVDDWTTQKRRHEENETSYADHFLRLNDGDFDLMAKHFSDVLSDISWPQETNVSFDLRTDGCMFIDVDLPEIEDMPSKTAAYSGRGYKLSVKEMSATQVQKLYMLHIHSLGLRIAGEAFGCGETIKMVVLSGYSQRGNKATGNIGDEYLYSVRITRNAWTRLNFSRLDTVDPILAFGEFEVRRDMSKTGVFTPVLPFEI